jgi:hypothetical protein
MNFVKCCCRLCFVVSLGIAVGAASDALLLNGPPAPFMTDISNRPIPKFENGFVISFDPRPANVWLFDRQGNRVRELVLSVPSPYVSVVRISDAAASRDGRVAIAATATTDNGKAGTLIAWFDSSGNPQKIVRTAPFASHQVAFATDGTLWAVGNVYNEQRTSDVPVHDVVQHFDVDGRVLGTLLPNISFNTRGYPASGAFLRTANGKMAIYFVRTKEWVEIANSGELLGRWPVPIAAAARVTGIALTSSGTVLFTADFPDGKNEQEPAVYRFDKRSGKLVQLDASALGGEYPMLLGADGDHLAIFGQRPFKIVSAVLAMP